MQDKDINIRRIYERMQEAKLQKLQGFPDPAPSVMAPPSSALANSKPAAPQSPLPSPIPSPISEKRANPTPRNLIQNSSTPIKSSKAKFTPTNDTTPPLQPDLDFTLKPNRRNSKISSTPSRSENSDNSEYQNTSSSKIKQRSSSSLTPSSYSLSEKLPTENTSKPPDIAKPRDSSFSNTSTFINTNRPLLGLSDTLKISLVVLFTCFVLLLFGYIAISKISDFFVSTYLIPRLTGSTNTDSWMRNKELIAQKY